MSHHVVKLPIKNGYKYVAVPDEYFITLNRTTTPCKQSPLEEETSLNPSASLSPPPLSYSLDYECGKTTRPCVQGEPCFFSPKDFLNRLFSSDLPEHFILNVNNNNYRVVKEI